MLRPAAFRHPIGQAREALGAFSTATRLAPDVAHLHFNLGNALNVKGRPEAALPAYGKAIEIEPGNPVFHNNLGNRLQELQRLDDAAQALEPRYGDAHYNLGLVHEARDDFEAAIAFDIYPEAWPMG